MGHLKDIANQSKIQSFPNSTYEIEGTPPATQCLRAELYATDGATTGPPQKVLNHFAKFLGLNLTGDICTIMTNPGGNTGDFLIDFNTDDQLRFLDDPGTGNPTQYYVHNDTDRPALRDLQSFAEHLSSLGKAYTIKGGKLYTNTAPGGMQQACLTIFNPLT